MLNFLPYWRRGANGERVAEEVPDRPTIEDIDQRINAIQVATPYFQQAAQVVLFDKTNTNTYPATMDALRDEDDDLIAANAYNGLNEGQKAQLLIDAAKLNLGL